MRRRSQETLVGLCLLLPALALLACRDDRDPADEAPGAALPIWGSCENWEGRDRRCDQAALLADHEECVRTEGEPERQRMRAAGVAGLARRRAAERITIVCLEKRGWRMRPEGFRHLPGRRPPPPPPS
jgi:hypothetical protein